MNAIEALCTSAQRVGDPKLQQELLGRIGEIRRSFEAQQQEIENMRARLNGRGNPAPALDYDPPA